MSKRSERILQSIQAAQISYGTLHEMTGIPKSALQRYATGETEKIPIDRIELIAKATGVSAAYLMGWDVDKHENTMPVSLEPYRPRSRMPVLGRVNAGLPMYAEENIEEYIANDYTDGYEYFALRVKGDSMNAAGIVEGDYIVVRRQDTVDNGTIAIVLVNGDDATVKRFSRNGDTVVLTPQSHNPVHQVQIYNTKEIPIRVIGKVVETRHKF